MILSYDELDKALSPTPYGSFRECNARRTPESYYKPYQCHCRRKIQ